LGGKRGREGNSLFPRPQRRGMGNARAKSSFIERGGEAPKRLNLRKREVVAQNVSAGRREGILFPNIREKRKRNYI